MKGGLGLRRKIVDGDCLQNNFYSICYVASIRRKLLKITQSKNL